VASDLAKGLFSQRSLPFYCVIPFWIVSLTHREKKNTTKAKNIEFVIENARENVYFTSFSPSHFFPIFFFSLKCDFHVCVCVTVKKEKKRSHATNEKKTSKKRHAVDLRKPKYLLSAFNSNASKRHQSELISMKRLS